MDYSSCVSPAHTKYDTWTNAVQALKSPAGQTFKAFGNFRVRNSASQQGSIVRDPVTIDFETRKHAALLENEWSFENSFEKAAPQMDFWTCGHWTIIWRACCQKGQHHIYKHLIKSLEGHLWSWRGKLWKFENFGGEKDGEKTLHANNKEKTCFGQVWK